MIHLAELNEDNICISVKTVKSFIDDGKHVKIENSSSYYLWRKYEDGQWSEEKFFPPEPELQVTIEDKINYIFYKQMGVI